MLKGKRKPFVSSVQFAAAAGFGSGLQFWGLQDRGFRTEERGIVSSALERHGRWSEWPWEYRQCLKGCAVAVCVCVCVNVCMYVCE